MVDRQINYSVPYNPAEGVHEDILKNPPKLFKADKVVFDDEEC